MYPSHWGGFPWFNGHEDRQGAYNDGYCCSLLLSLSLYQLSSLLIYPLGKSIILNIFYHTHTHTHTYIYIYIWTEFTYRLPTRVDFHKNATNQPINHYLDVKKSSIIIEYMYSRKMSLQFVQQVITWNSLGSRRNTTYWLGCLVGWLVGWFLSLNQRS